MCIPPQSTAKEMLSIYLSLLVRVHDRPQEVKRV
jgi:hypothetical protein